MQLTSGHPYWTAKNGFIHTYEPLRDDVDCDVAVLGGGITGALIAKALVERGYQTVVVDRRNLGWGSTSASTALLQYEIDTHLTDLTEMLGRIEAETAYRSCCDAINRIRDLCADLNAGEYAPRKSLYFASRPRDVARLQAEFAARNACGLEVEWLTQPELTLQFDAPAYGGILSHQAAVIDPYQLAHAIWRRLSEAGTRIFARTTVTDLISDASGVTLSTDRGGRIQCRWAIIAAGYESLSFLAQKPAVTLHNTFAFATEPIGEFAGWPADWLLWESARPYIYARSTADRRAIFGGEDIPFKSPAIRERFLPRKISRLQKRWGTMFPRIPLEVSATWGGTFAETADGLPYIGVTPQSPRTFFALCYGGNGITYSAIAAEMAVAALTGERHRCDCIYGLDRDTSRGRVCRRSA